MENGDWFFLGVVVGMAIVAIDVTLTDSINRRRLAPAGPDVNPPNKAPRRRNRKE